LKEVLQVKTVDIAKNFYEHGGNSLILIYFLSKILTEFEVNVLGENIRTMSILEISTHISLRKNDQAQRKFNTQFSDNNIKGKSIEKIQFIANRFSYFLKRENNLEYWHVCSPVFEGDIDPTILKKSIDILISHYDDLRLGINIRERNHFIFGEKDMDSFIHIRYRNERDGDYKAFLESKIQQLRSSFTFDNCLFKVLLITNKVKKASHMVLIAHHLLVDAYSFRMLLKDLVSLYKNHENLSLAYKLAKSTTFSDFTEIYIQHQKKYEIEEWNYWRSLKWSEITYLPLIYSHGNNNIEKYTTYSVSSHPFSIDNDFGRIFNNIDHSENLIILLYAIGKSYQRLTGHSKLCIAVLFHGRESFCDEINLSNTLGWFSETVPILIDNTQSLEDQLIDLRSQVIRASSKGKSYGYLRYLSDNKTIRKELEINLYPQISFNFVPSSLRKYDYSSFKRCDSYSLGIDNIVTTKRVFLLSGGAFIKDDNFIISWDYSHKNFEKKNIDNFSRDCMREYLLYIKSKLSMLNGNSEIC